MAATRENTMQSTKKSSDDSGLDLARPTGEVLEYLRDYARENPEMAAMWCFGIGFVLGWRLKPW